MKNFTLIFITGIVLIFFTLSTCIEDEYSDILLPDFQGTTTDNSFSILNAFAISSSEVCLLFNLTPDSDSSLLAENYSIIDNLDNNLEVQSVEADENNSKVVIINTSDMESGTLYTITAVNIISEDGIELSVSENSYLFIGYIDDPTVDLVSPVITITSVQTNNESMTISWETDEEATINVYYGTDDTYVSQISEIINESADSTTHSVELTGLTSDTLYYIKIESIDDAGNITTYTFTNRSSADVANNNGWFTAFREYPDNPVVSELAGERRYYPCVVYDDDSFGYNALGSYKGIDGFNHIWLVDPHYLMWTGDGSGTDMYYSDDGIYWFSDSSLQDVITGHYHPFVLYREDGFPDETDKSIRFKMWNWDYDNSVGPDNLALDYYTSVDGIIWTRDAAGRITHECPASTNPPTGDNIRLADDCTGASEMYSVNMVLDDDTGTYHAWFNLGKILCYGKTTTSKVASSWDDFLDETPGDTTDALQNISEVVYGNPDTNIWTNGTVSVVLRNGIFEMWFSSGETGYGDSGTSSDNKSINYAQSTDGYHVTLVDNIETMGQSAADAGPAANPVLVTNSVNLWALGDNSWRDSRTYTPLVIYDENMFSGNGEYRNYKMWFTGDGTDGRILGYASFNLPSNQ